MYKPEVFKLCFTTPKGVAGVGRGSCINKSENDINVIHNIICTLIDDNNHNKVTTNFCNE